MLQDTVGFVELSQLPESVAEGTVAYLNTAYENYVVGHYKFESGQWHPFGGGGSGGGGSTLIPTFRPAVGTVLTNQMDQRDRVLANGASHASSKYPALADVLNIGLPNTFDDFKSDITGVYAGKAVGDSHYLIGELEGASGRHLIQFNRQTFEVEESWQFPDTRPADLVTDGRHFIIRVSNNWLDCCLFDRETGALVPMGSLLQDMATEGAIEGLAPIGVHTIGSDVFVVLGADSPGNLPNAIQVLTPSGTWGTRAISLQSNALGTISRKGIIYFTENSSGWSNQLKRFNPQDNDISEIASSLGDITVQTSTGALDLDNDFLYIGTTATGNNVDCGIAKIPWSSIEQQNIEGAQHREFTPDFSGSLNSAPESITVLGQYVFVAVKHLRSYGIVVFDKESLEEITRYSGDNITNSTLVPSYSTKGVFIPRTGAGNIPKLFSFSEFTTPVIDDVIPGVPVLLQAR